MFRSKPWIVSSSTGTPISIVSTTITFTTIGKPNSYASITNPMTYPSTNGGNICNGCHVTTQNTAMTHYTTTGSDGHKAGQVCTSCHTHSGSTTKDGGAFGASGGGCNGCHDYDTTGETWGSNAKAIEGFGAHAKHINHLKSVYSVTLNAATDNFGTGSMAKVCGTCHTNTESGNHDTGGGGTRTINFGDGSYLAGSTFNFVFGAGTPTYNGRVGQSSSSYVKSCSNISCHFTDTPAWSSY
jgi:hypothetical protein